MTTQTIAVSVEATRQEGVRDRRRLAWLVALRQDRGAGAGCAPGLRTALRRRRRGGGVPFEPGDYEVVERTEGAGGTDFGVPSSITDLDRRPVDVAEAERQARLVKAAWTVLARVAAGAPAELRKGPRGGGRDRDKMVGHVAESEGYYAREIGIK